VFQGGGEVPSAWVFVAEHAPAGHRGYALGFLQAGLTFGYLLGALTATFLAQAFTRSKSSITPGVTRFCWAACLV
jgi:MFS family permease